MKEISSREVLVSDCLSVNSLVSQKLSHAWLRGRQRPDNKTLSTFPSLQLSSIHTLGNKSKEEEDIIIEREKVGQVFCVCWAHLWNVSLSPSYKWRTAANRQTRDYSCINWREDKMLPGSQDAVEKETNGRLTVNWRIILWVLPPVNKLPTFPFLGS